MDAKLPDIALAEHLADRIAAVDAGELPAAAREKCEDLLVDVAGLCVAARNDDYIAALAGGTTRALHGDRPCAHVDAAGAAFVNGTAAHGEDFDDTFEGGPVHAGAVIVPAVLAACERHNGSTAAAALLGIAVGVEVMCRLSLVAPKAVHKAGFHPTAVFGAMGAAAGVGAALRLDQKQIVDALGIAGRWPRASSNISPRAPGPSACMPAGRRNRACARRCWHARVSPGRARCSKACTVSSMASPTRREGDFDALTRRFRQALA